MMRPMTTLERAEAAERAMSEELDRVIVKSVLYTSGELDPTKPVQRPPDGGRRYLMGPDPRLPKMPEKPTILDFFTYRVNAGMATAAKMPMIATTIINSTRVKPPLFLRDLII